MKTQFYVPYLTFIWIRLNDITYSCEFDNKIKFMSIEGTNSLT